jgi:hypothetical protein
MSETVKQSVNRADPNLLADLLRNLKFGDVLRALPVFLRKQVPVADASFPSGTNGIKLPDDAKAALKSRAMFAAYARAGAGTIGQLTAVVGTPANAGEVGVSDAGDILFYAADAWTNVDVEYFVEKQDVITLTLPVSSNAMALPSTLVSQGVVSLLAASSLAGSSTGVKVVEAPSASAASAGCARLDLAKANVKFHSGESTSATVVLGIACATDVNALLESVAAYV